MRVLHLPVNIASYPSNTIRGLREVGVDARGLVFSSAPVQSAQGLKVVEPFRRKPSSWTWTEILRFYYPLWYFYYAKWLVWADVIHWYYGAPALPFGLDLTLLKALDKPSVVEWLGSDIRIPEVESADNPYYKAAFQSGYEYRRESLAGSRRIQKRFADAGFACIVPACMLRYVQRDLFSRAYVVPQRILLSDFSPSYPDPGVTRPLIVHSSTAPTAKGTLAVLRAIECVKGKFDIEFRLIQRMPRIDALQLVQTADIYLEQFVLGDHGMAALEAMACGKPVLSYIKPSMIDQYPQDCPIVNANQDNLADILEPLVKDGHLRHEIGKRSREYVERHHDAVKLGKQLAAIYHELMEGWKANARMSLTRKNNAG